MDIPAILTSATSALTLLKAIRDIDVATDQAIFRARLVDLQEQLTDIRAKLLDAREEAEAKDVEIAKLKAFPQQLDQLVRWNGYHYETAPDGKGQGQPYCPFCIEKKRGFFRIRTIEGKPRGAMYCPESKSEYANVATLPWQNAAAQ